MTSVYAKCKADPMEPDFVETFKSLHPVFNEPLELETVSEKSFLYYVVLTYDIESPFVIKHRDWAQRRRETARICRFPKKGDKYEQEAEDIIFGNNKKTNKVILHYLFLQNDLDFITAQSYQALLFRQTYAAMFSQFDNPANYDKLKQNIDVLTTDLKSVNNAIFHGDETIEMKRAFYDFVSQLSMDIRPEDIAERKELGEPLVDEIPYPEGYDVDVLKFVGDE